MEEAGQLYIKTGDLIELFSAGAEEDGFVSCWGTSDEQLIIKTTKDKDCIFKIFPMIQYDEGAGSSTREKEERAMDNIQLEGKVLIFGQIIQLQQRRTNRFIASDHDTVTNFGSGTQSLTLTKQGSKRCWFKVMPHLKGEEGDKVRESDKIKLVHVLTGYILHQSESVNRDNHYEVELKSYFGSNSTNDNDNESITPWTLKLTDTINQRATLKNKAVVRFFHETSGYLLGKQNQPLKSKFYAAGGNDRVSSYSTMWEVIEEQISSQIVSVDDGGGEDDTAAENEILWNKRVQFRLFGTSLYLAIKAEEGATILPSSDTQKDTNTNYTLYLTQDSKNQFSFFSFVPIKKESEEIPYGTQLWIQSATTKTWVHCSQDFAYVTGKKGATQSDVYAVRQFNSKNTFMVKVVPNFQVVDFNFVAQQISSLTEYILKKDKKSKTERKECITVLSSLVSFCTDKHDIPHTSHQRLLGSPSNIRVLVEITQIGPYQDIKITTLAWTCLKNITRNNPKIGSLLSTMIQLPDFHQLSPEEAEYFKVVPIAETLIEMYKKNSELIYGLKEEFVEQIFQIITANSDHQYFDFLMTVCHYEDTVVHNNQKIIVTLLDKYLSKVVKLVTIEGSEIMVETSKGKVPLISDFTATVRRSHYKDEITYVCKLLQLYSHLAFGRNSMAISFITSPKIRITFALAFQCLRSDSLLPSFRSAFCDLVLHLFVDVYPNSPWGTTFRRVCSLSKASHLLGQGELTDVNDITYDKDWVFSPFAETEYKFPLPMNLGEFLIDYVFYPYNSRFDPRQQESNQPHFFARVMVLIRHFFFFGHFKSKQSILIQRVIELLNIEPDFNHENQPRHLDATHQQLLVTIKSECLIMLDRYLDVLTSLLFEQYINNIGGKARSESKKEILEKLIQKILIPAEERDQLPKLLLKADDFKIDGITSALLRQLHHNNTQLSSKALYLLKRIMCIQNKWVTLAKSIISVQLLTKPQEKEVYAKVEEQLFDKQGGILCIAAQCINEEKKSVLIELINEFADQAYDGIQPNTAHQMIFCNSNLYLEILNLIKRPIETDGTIGKKGEHEIIFACYNFLRAFCMKNPTNQRVLHSHLDFMIHQMILCSCVSFLSCGITATIVEIFRDNIELCKNLTEKHIFPFMDIILSPEHQSVFVEFFRVIMKPSGFILKSNQNIILKLLLSNPKTMRIITAAKQKRASPVHRGLANQKGIEQVQVKRDVGDENDGDKGKGRDGPDRRFDNMSEKRKDSEETDSDSENKKENDKKRKKKKNTEDKKESEKTSDSEVTKDHDPKESDHELSLSLVTIFALCAEGRNYFTEAACQKLISLEECIEISTQNSEKFCEISAAYILFADEVYLNTENEIVLLPALLELQYRKSLWKLVERFLTSIEDAVQKNTLREDLGRYLFEIILPFVQHFYARCFSSKNATPRHLELSNKLVDAIYSLREVIKKDIEKNSVALDTLRAMTSVGLHGSYPKRLMKLMKSSLASAPRNYRPSTDEKRKAFLYEMKKFSQLVSHATYASIVADYMTPDQDDNYSEEDPILLDDTTLTSPDKITLLPSTFINLDVNGGDENAVVDPTASGTGADQYLGYLVGILSRDHDQRDDKLTVACLRLLCEYLMQYCAGISTNKTPLQKFADIDAPNHVISLLSSQNKKIVGLSLECLCLMLTAYVDNKPAGTASNVAAVLLRTFTSQGNLQAFYNLVEIFNDAKSEIKDHKLLQGNVSQNLSDIIYEDNGVELEFSPWYFAYTAKPKTSPSLYSYALRLLELLAANKESSIFKMLLVRNDLDMVKEVVILLKAYEPTISKSNIELAVQIFSTLKEFVRNSPTNQNAAVAAQVLNPVNKILLNDFKGRERREGDLEGEENDLGEDPDLLDQIHVLKLTIVEFLISLVEDADPSIHVAVISHVKSTAFEKSTDVLSEQNTVTRTDASVTLASKSFRLIKFLVDSDPNRNKEYLDSLEVCEGNCQSRIGRIEVISKGRIETIYFPIPQDFRKPRPTTSNGILSMFSSLFHENKTREDVSTTEISLNHRLDNKLMEGSIDWDRAGDRIDAFVSWSERELLRREQESAAVTGKGYWLLLYRIARLWNVWLLVSFILSIIINITLLVTVNIDTVTNKLRWFGFFHILPKIFTDEDYKHDSPELTILGALQTIVSCLMLSSYLIRNGAYINGKQWLRRLKSDECYMLMPFEKVKHHQLRQYYRFFEPFYWAISLWNIVSDPHSLFYFVYVIFSFLGNIVSDFFFAFHLMQIFLQSSRLKLIVHTLSLNATRLIVMFILTLEIVYIFSIIAYNFYPMQYPEETGYYCKSLIECMATNTFYGVNSGGALFQYPKPFFPDLWAGDLGYGAGWVAFVVLYFFAIGPIMLNTTFAIIVDTFGHLRERRTLAKRALSSTCFICSLEREIFQQKAKDFNTHIEREHNRMHYFYFFAYLKDLDTMSTKTNETVELSPLEEDIKVKISERKFLKFFPVGKALSLESLEEEDEFNSRMLQKVGLLEKQVDLTSQQQDKIFKQTSDTNRQLQFLLTQLKKTNSEIHHLKNKIAKQ